MTSAEALLMVRGYAGANRVRFTRHALEEAENAGVTEEEVVEALAKATDCSAGNVSDRWVVKGPTRDGGTVKAVVSIEDGILVITVM